MAKCVLPHFSCFLVLGLFLDCSAQLSRIDNGRKQEPSSLLSVATQDAETAESLWPKAKAAMQQGNFAEARRLLRQAVQQDPTDGALWFHLGASCAEVNELDEAVTALERARSLAQRQADTYFN